MGPEEIRAYQIYLTNERKLAASSILIAIAALRFLLQSDAQERLAFRRHHPRSEKAQTLPVVLSPEEVLQFLNCISNNKHRAILSSCYAAGLRISEAIQLTISAIDSARMVLRVEQGKGQKDRYLMLSPRLLQILRTWWRVERPKHWLFPGDLPDRHISRHAVWEACQKAHCLCGNRKPITPPYTRVGIYEQVKRYGHRAALAMPSIATKQVSPHIIRHSSIIQVEPRPE